LRRILSSPEPESEQKEPAGQRARWRIGFPNFHTRQAFSRSTAGKREKACKVSARPQK
jgi:hypothetical protein